MTVRILYITDIIFAEQQVENQLFPPEIIHEISLNIVGKFLILVSNISLLTNRLEGIVN